MMRIAVLGGDGYLGWPLALKLAGRYPHAEILLVDNGLRRKMVAEVGGNSITPILPLEQRLEQLHATIGWRNVRAMDLDVSQPEVERLFEAFKPTHIYHLAQQASAPFSMSSVERAVTTVQNNEIGNLRILFAMRQHVPNAHLIKLGSFGEYAKGGLDIAEGYFQPTWKGKTASRPVPYPRESDDIYHISKINDTNYISMACRKWNLRVTDIMQCTIFGILTEETRGIPSLYTRLDYDAVFGTVVNRFVAQIVSGHPMTVYGTGLQRTGLMGLEDSLNSLADLAEMHPSPGEHKVINHVTERGYCILELAEAIAALARRRGLSPRIERTHDPRVENPAEKMKYDIDAHHVSRNVSPTPLDKVLEQTFALVHTYAHRINEAVFPPEIQW